MTPNNVVCGILHTDYIQRCGALPTQLLDDYRHVSSIYQMKTRLILKGLTFLTLSFSTAILKQVLLPTVGILLHFVLFHVQWSTGIFGKSCTAYPANKVFIILFWWKNSHPSPVLYRKSKFLSSSRNSMFEETEEDFVLSQWAFNHCQKWENLWKEGRGDALRNLEENSAERKAVFYTSSKDQHYQLGRVITYISRLCCLFTFMFLSLPLLCILASLLLLLQAEHLVRAIHSLHIFLSQLGWQRASFLMLNRLFR